SDNEAGFTGGAMVNYGTATLTNVSFSDNHGGSGATLSSIGTLSLTNVTFFRNDSGALDSSGLAKLTNVTSSGNRSGPHVGNNAAFFLGGNATLTNCVLWGDADQEIFVLPWATAIVNYSDVQGGFAGAGNIDAGPLF